MKTSCTLLLSGIMAGISAVPIRAELANRIEAVVSDAIITSQQVEQIIAQPQWALRDRYQNQPEVYQQKMGELVQSGEEELIRRELILHDFNTSHFNLPESIIDEIVHDEIREKYSDDRVQFIKDLQSRGMTFEQYRKQVRDRLIVEQMTHTFVPEPIISPHRIEAYYNEHRETYKVEDQVKTRMIVINQGAGDPPGTARKRAEEILSRIKAGTSFQEMSIYSEGSQRRQGGEDGWLELAKLAEAIREPVSKLKAGECSGVIETPGACFLVLLEERRPAHYQPLSELRDEIEKTLKVQEQSRLQKRWIERLKKKTYVTHF